MTEEGHFLRVPGAQEASHSLRESTLRLQQIESVLAQKLTVGSKPSDR